MKGYYLDNFFPWKHDWVNKSAFFNSWNWLCVRSFAQNQHGFSGHWLQPGDIIKVGRLVFGVWSIFDGFQEEQTASSQQSLKLSDLNPDYFLKEKIRNNKDQLEIDKEDPMNLFDPKTTEFDHEEREI